MQWQNVWTQVYVAFVTQIKNQMCLKHVYVLRTQQQFVTILRQHDSAAADSTGVAILLCCCCYLYWL